MNPVYRLGWYLCRIFFFTWCRIRVEGLGNLPATGPVILCANHISNLDPLLVGCLLPRPISFMAKNNLFKFKPMAWLLHTLGAFPVNRGAADRSALRQSLQVLEEGKVFGIFPEGTRSKTGELGQARGGVGFIVVKSEAPVIPVAISGQYGLRRTIWVRFGKPQSLSDLTGDLEGTKDRELVADRIWQEIARLVESTPKANA